MLVGKTALVTGSTSGIGLGIARALAQMGCNIVLNGIADGGIVASLVQDIEGRSGVKVIFDGTDLSDGKAARSMIPKVEKQLAPIDILVNNAGIQHVDLVEDFPVEKWDQIIAINLSAAFHTAAMVIPGMKMRNYGRIINIASAHGLVASPKKTAYVAAKHGLVGLTKTIALEVAEQNITCNAICPGWVLTPLVERQIDANAKQKLISKEQAEKELLMEKQPAKQFVTPEQIGQMVVYLCSDAARLVTGAHLSIDGGWTAQ